MTTSAVLGIDPGVRGGLALLRPDGSISFMQGFYPEMAETDFMSLLFLAVSGLRQLRSREVFMEKVGYLPGDGGQGAFTFGKVYGLLRGALLAHGLKLTDVYPQAWQARMECLSRGNKNVTKNKAILLFPGAKITHSVADALLIARFGQLRLAR